MENPFVIRTDQAEILKNQEAKLTNEKVEAAAAIFVKSLNMGLQEASLPEIRSEVQEVITREVAAEAFNVPVEALDDTLWTMLRNNVTNKLNGMRVRE